VVFSLVTYHSPLTYSTRNVALPMSQYILSLDQGTTSSRSILFGRHGRVVAAAQQEFPQILPSPGHGSRSSTRPAA
jgi:hypothetical protein